MTLLLILRYVSVFGGGTLMPLNNAISRPEKKPKQKNPANLAFEKVSVLKSRRCTYMHHSMWCLR